MSFTEQTTQHCFSLLLGTTSEHCNKLQSWQNYPELQLSCISVFSDCDLRNSNYCHNMVEMVQSNFQCLYAILDWAQDYAQYHEWDSQCNIIIHDAVTTSSKIGVLQDTRYKIQETLFNVGLHNTETLAQ